MTIVHLPLGIGDLHHPIARRRSSFREVEKMAAVINSKVSIPRNSG